MEVAGGKVWILKTPDREDVRELCLAGYWSIVRVVLDQYRPAVVERAAAVHLYLDDFSPPNLLTVRHSSSRSRYTVKICEGLSVRLSAGSVDQQHIVNRQPMGVDIPVDGPEETLLRLTLGVLRENLGEVAMWLRTLVVSRPALEAAYAREPRPLVVKRLSHLARELRNDRLAEQLDALLATVYSHRIGRGQTGVGRALNVPQYIISLPRARTVWLERHAATYAHFRELLSTPTASLERKAPRSSISTLLERAHEAKAYDAYHSTTIEGYKITPEEVSAVLRNEPVAGHDPERVRSRMAIAGYGQAFERCLGVLRNASGNVPINEALIADLHVDLFAPSVEAGILSAEDLRGYRREPAYLRGSRYVPPAPEKVPALMTEYAELTNAIVERPVLRAIMAHLDFATIHPYADGNGRIARFLMNLALVGEGLPWMTIHIEDRGIYFEAVEAAQVGDDPMPFAKFIMNYVDRSAQPRGTRRT
ncbi:MAG TPA: Fic family protein [bacterium]|nr:Fic family protein [bacterium]